MKRILHLLITLSLIIFLVLTLLNLFFIVSGNYVPEKGSEGWGWEGYDSTKSYLVSLTTQPLSTMGTYPLFNVTNAKNTKYLRFVTAHLYDGRKWSFGNYSDGIPYNGEELSFGVKGYAYLERGRVSVTPIQKVGGFIPTSLYTYSIDFPGRVVHYPEHNVFYTDESTNETYEFSTINYYFTSETLRSAEVVKDDRYLQLPEAITERTKNLALNLTTGLSGTYEKIKALEKYLRENYVYDENYMGPPPNWEPNDWFLFEERRGVCVNFNSALAVLARCLNVPTRVALGFLIKPTAEEQTVKANQTHAWVEVGFKELGWISFDATPYGGVEACLGEGEMKRGDIKTFTVITSISERELRRGHSFNVTGTVLSETGRPVHGMSVVIYLDGNGKNEYIPVGLGETCNGTFNLVCMIPREIDIGYYNLIAQTLGKDGYAPSESLSKIRVKVISPTKITVSAPRRVQLKRAFQINGALLDDVGKPIPDQEIRVYIDQKLFATRLTDAQGVFRVPCTLEEEGKHEIDFVYLGVENQTLLIYSPPANHRIEFFYPKNEFYSQTKENFVLRADIVDIQPYTGRFFIRGCPQQVWGRVYFGGEPLDNETVQVKIDDYVMLETTTDNDGVFNIIQTFPCRLLGSHQITYNLTELNYSETYEFILESRTKLKVMSPHEVKPGERFVVAAILTDDLGNPISGALINLNNQQKTTNLKGVSEFEVEIPKDFDENHINIETTFEGSDLYLPSSSLVKVPVKTGVSLAYYIIPVAVALFSVSLLVLKRQGVLGYQKTSDGEVLKSEVGRSIEKMKVNLAIELPDIIGSEEVWGVGDRLRVKARLAGSNGREIYGKRVKILVGARMCALRTLVGEVTTGLSDGFYDCCFEEKGEFEIVGKFDGDEFYSSAISKRTVKVVDYREEVINIYLGFLERLKSEGLDIPLGSTAREIKEILVGNAVWMMPKMILDKLTRYFEEARYSTHLITRRDYQLAVALMEQAENRIVVRWSTKR